VPKNMWLSEISFEDKIDRKNASKITRSLSIKGYYIIDEKMGDKDVVNNFLGKLKDSRTFNKGMPKADIVSVKKIDINGKKVASFEISFIGP
jgi:hypothetical protein